MQQRRQHGTLPDGLFRHRTVWGHWCTAFGTRSLATDDCYSEILHTLGDGEKTVHSKNQKKKGAMYVQHSSVDSDSNPA